MNQSKISISVALLLVSAAGIASARAVRVWSYAEMMDKSDLVVLAAPESVSDMKEDTHFPEIPGLKVVGVETRFKVSLVLKGDVGVKEFVLHHYRMDESIIQGVIDGPNFISFADLGLRPVSRKTYLLFLSREKDGRFAPVVGQMDPDLAIKLVNDSPDVSVKNVKPWMGENYYSRTTADALKECEAI